MPSDIARLLRATRYAAEKHRNQRRKGGDAAPYINHPIAVAERLVSVGGVAEVDVLIAALLHDTVEDTGVTPEQLEAEFGSRVRELVAEVTDDKRLPKARRKELQVEHAPHLSTGAKLIKLSDKISNIHDIVNNPPADWPLQRKLEYLDWGERVVAGLRGVNQGLEDFFDQLLATAREKFASDAKNPES
jgi:guanosine-3',5'-bis(diphosphate) 3'-pyrophosphohydrolase